MLAGLCAPAMALLGFAAPALAQQPIVHLKFDGSLANSGSNGVQAEAVSPGSRGETPAAIDYSEGWFGEAAAFDGDVVLRMPIQLNKEQYGQFTFTGWIYTDEDWNAEAPMISNGSHLWVNIWGRHVQMKCYRCIITHTGKAVPPERWVFVAAVWNAAENEAALYLDQRVVRYDELDLSEEPEASEYLWIGVRDGATGSPKANMRIDDLRLYDQALSASQIAAIRRGAAPDSPLTGQPRSDGPVVADGGEITPDIGGASDIEKAKQDGAASAKSSTPPVVETTEQPAGDGQRRVIGWRINHDNSYTSKLAGRSGDLSRILQVSTPGAGIQRLGWQTDKGMACRMLIDDDSNSTDWEKEAGTCKYVMGSRVANLDGGYMTDLYFSPKATPTDGLDKLILTAYRINEQGQLVDEIKETTKDIDTIDLPLPILPPLIDPDYQFETSCIRDHVATGLVAHYKRRATNATTIVGLQLICSAVVKLYGE